MTALPSVGARYRSLLTDERCVVKDVDAMSKRVLVLLDAGREWLPVADFNAAWRLSQATGIRRQS